MPCAPGSRPVRRLAVGLLAGGLALGSLAACGGGGDDKGLDLSDQERSYAERIGTLIGEDLPMLSKEDRTCTGGAVVKAVGVDKFTKASIEPRDIDDDFELSDVTGEEESRFSPAQVDRFAANLEDCGTAELMAVAGISLVSRDQLSPKQAQKYIRCAADKIDPDDVEPTIALHYASSDSSAAQSDEVLIKLLKACGGRPVVLP